MSESIIKFITKVNDINIGVGVASLTGEIKLSPFTIQENNIIKSELNNDEFGFHFISEDKDFENLKHFYFGIDLTGALKAIDLTSHASIDLYFNKTLKSNEQILHAYRKITKNEIKIDKNESLKLTENAINVLKVSTHKFHELYGDYFISSYSRGGALSVFGHISKSDNQSNNNFEQKFSLEGNLFKKIVDKNVNDEIALKKSSLNSFQFTECKSESIGLNDETKTTDFQQMIDKLEHLENSIGNGSILFYEISKYELCDEYMRIKNEKSKWQMYLEDFTNLSIELQRDNIEFYQEIKKNLECEKTIDLKEQEIETEIRLKELIKQNNKTNVDKCVEYIISNNINQAVQILEPTIENISTVISKVLINDSSSNFMKMIDFANNLKNGSEKALAFIVIFSFKEKLGSKQTVQLAYNIEKQRNNSVKEFSRLTNELYEHLRKFCIPACLGGLFSSERVSIKSFKFNRYLYVSEYGQVMMTRDKKLIKEIWIFSSNDNGETFTVENENYGFLMLSENSKQNLIVRKEIEHSAYWYLELADNNVALRLKNCKSNEYLCTDRYLFHDKIFTTEENEDVKSLFLITISSVSAHSKQKDFSNKSSNGFLNNRHVKRID
jgi:hypothetical protein